jgi:hypothetical protein
MTRSCFQPVPTILFAGEAASVNAYATMHGAYYTGRDEAARLNEIYSV